MYRYIEIANELERQLDDKKMKPGDKVSSVRQLCKDYKCHQTTAVKALNLLKEKNVLYSVPQSGYYVSGKEEDFINPSETIDFKSASPDSRFFPCLEYQKCVNLAIEKNRSELFKYSVVDGYQPLKKLLVS